MEEFITEKIIERELLMGSTEYLLDLRDRLLDGDIEAINVVSTWMIQEENKFNGICA